jgi:hypothetical protein
MFTNRMNAMTNAIVETVETGLEQTTLHLEVPSTRGLSSDFFLFVYVNFRYSLAKKVLSREE